MSITEEILPVRPSYAVIDQYEACCHLSRASLQLRAFQAVIRMLSACSSMCALYQSSLFFFRLLSPSVLSAPSLAAITRPFHPPLPVASSPSSIVHPPASSSPLAVAGLVSLPSFCRRLPASAVVSAACLLTAYSATLNPSATFPSHHLNLFATSRKTTKNITVSVFSCKRPQPRFPVFASRPWSFAVSVLFSFCPCLHSETPSSSR